MAEDIPAQLTLLLTPEDVAHFNGRLRFDRSTLLKLLLNGMHSSASPSHGGPAA